MISITVQDASQVAEARRAAVTLAQAHGFDEAAAGRVAIVATELSTNMLKHGEGGVLLVGAYDDDATGAGVECVALDRGEGMPDVDASMRDGHSTAGSPGTGLGAVARGSQTMDVYSAPRLGTAILARLEAERPTEAKRDVRSDYGGVSVPMKGEEACGDVWCRRQGAQSFTLMVADGLGHGPLEAGALLVLASVGIGTSWRLDAYPGLSQRHPTLIAGVLLRDFSRGRDDATVLVARIGAA